MITSKQRITSKAILKLCRCGTHTLVARVSGGIVHADAQNITPYGELIARLQNRGTYDVRIIDWPPRISLHWRSYDRIRASRKHPVVPEHRCGQPLETGPSPPYDGLPLIRTETPSGECPF
jgi:hypothetical protein